MEQSIDSLQLSDCGAPPDAYLLRSALPGKAPNPTADPAWQHVNSLRGACGGVSPQVSSLCASRWQLQEPCHAFLCEGVKAGTILCDLRERRDIFFRPPSDAERLELWERAFHDDGILNVLEHNICGDVVATPCDKSALKHDAVPRLFPNCPKYLFKPTRNTKHLLADCPRQKASAEENK
ncbi:hypothetical protein HPB47_005706, partial [Ixodes persulcatus]